jgi:ABC-type polysaccharide/polyol phosphate transport system ATPase subunit
LRQGELLGVIGINGAGKSTLLKILSQITEPTEGVAEIRGRVRSLLEVGTGFHAELTGRENIYLNGAILGMKRAEINRKFDEIVAFAEIEKFLDTPVKWYSSGMYTRLAFSVAAHLEPDVLVIDEVLAVGDAGFQRKCLAKMGNVAAGGRTVLFVSHNMQAVSQLTTRCVVLKDGECYFDGPTGEAVGMYLSFQQNEVDHSAQYEAPPGLAHNHVALARARTSDPNGLHHWGEPISFEFVLRISEPHDSLCFSFQVLNEFQVPVCYFWLFDADVPYRRGPGLFRLQCYIPKFRLYMGSYTLRTWLAERRVNTVSESLQSICPFDVTMHGRPREEYDWVSGACSYLEDATWLPVEEQRQTWD